jgi:hypothetical protein
MITAGELSRARILWVDFLKPAAGLDKTSGRIDLNLPQVWAKPPAGLTRTSRRFGENLPDDWSKPPAGLGQKSYTPFPCGTDIPKILNMTFVTCMGKRIPK